MNSVLIAAIWAGAAVITVVIFNFRLGKPIAELIRARQQSIEADTQRETAAALARENAVELDRRTVTERTELRQAELRRQTAEAEVETAVIQSSTEARIAAEGQVVTARAERRVQAAQEEPLNQPADPATMAALAKAYQKYVEEAPTNDRTGFGDWLGDTKWTTLDPGTMEALCSSYRAHCKATYSYGILTFNDWVGELTIKDGLLVKVA